jgi:hypothetical protein
LPEDLSAVTIIVYRILAPISCRCSGHPVGFICQQMLANSFSYQPMQRETEQGTACKLVCDFCVAQYLSVPDDSEERQQWLAKIVRAAVDEKKLV